MTISPDQHVPVIAWGLVWGWGEKSGKKYYNIGVLWSVMSIYGADASAERSLDPSAVDFVSVTRPGVQYVTNSMSYPSQEPNLPSDLWYTSCPPQPTPHLPSVTSGPPYMLLGEQFPPGLYNTASFDAGYKVVDHNPNAAMFPHYVKQEQSVIRGHASHPNLRLSQFIKQEPGLQDNNPLPLSTLDLANHNGSPHIQPNLGLHGGSPHHSQLDPQQQHHHHHDGAGQFSGLSLAHTTMHVSGPYAQNVSYIKQEPGLSVNHIPPMHARHEQGQNEGAPGPPLGIKQEPGLLAHVKQESGLLAHIKQEPGIADPFPLHSFTDHSLTPFPSKPINFNFMADIEDIVQPTTSGEEFGIKNELNALHNYLYMIHILGSMNFLPTEISIDSLKRELAGYEEPYGCYSMGVAGGSGGGGVVHIKREEEPIWEPPLWRQQYDNIRSMRSKRDAPVDKYGCFMNAERDVTPEVSKI